MGVPCCDISNISPAHSFSISNMTEAHTSTYRCDICMSVFNTAAVKTKCYHYFCSPCLSKVFTSALKNTIPCPTCTFPVDYADLEPVDDRFKIQILSLMLECTRCKAVSTLMSAHSHICTIDKVSAPMTRCTPSTMVKSPLQSPETRLTAKSSLSRSIRSPLNNVEEKLHTHLTRRKLSYSSATIYCKTRGQVKHLIICLKIKM